MNAPGKPRLLACAILAALVFGGLAQAGPPLDEPVSAELSSAWQKLAQLDFTGAFSDFSGLVKRDPDSRHARLGLALATLNRPPKSNAQTTAVARMLEAIRTEGPDDALGLLAAYELARLYHVHFHPPQFDEARRRFEALYAAHPEHYLAQNGLLRLATIDLFSQWPVADPAALVAKWEARKDDFKDPVVRRNFLRKLGDAILWFDLPAKRALPLFEEANEIGFARFDYRSLMLLKVFNISVEEGMTDLTRTVAKRYIREFPRDLWTKFMRDRLAELDAEAGR